ncbi:uncharacterized protein H6S33_006446 [Morchella sextelata]|uniref:uncharacterized protein n=1 Tax=Morchella sextelata TaxID=1174677 RepID=UPI001D04D802|nr:uncharacterized protein H6S33_006446 [Morchella sextelata]KAH0604778.1 hypothetical protein H6S33_006446 [Morchella sextelata]
MPSKNSHPRESECATGSCSKGSKSKGSKGSKGHEHGPSCSREREPSPERRVNEHTPLLQQVQQEQRSGRDPGEECDTDSLDEDELDFAFPPEGYIFTEIIQSPFEWISDGMVIVIRVVIAMCMTGLLGLYYYRERCLGNGRIFFFRLINIVWATQCFYMWLVTIWAVINRFAERSLPFPRPPLHAQTNLRTRLLSCLMRSRFLRTGFRCLYTTVTAIPFASSCFYLLILLPNINTPCYPWVAPEFTIAVGASVIAFIEIFVLNSITPVPGRFCGRHFEQALYVAVYALLYSTVWTRVGKCVVEFLHCCKYYCCG